MRKEEYGTVELVTRRNVLESELPADRPVSEVMCHPVRYVYDDCTVRQAADHMVSHGIGRLPIVSRQRPHRLVGIITRSDVMSVFQKRVRETELQTSIIALRPKAASKAG